MLLRIGRGKAEMPVHLNCKGGGVDCEFLPFAVLLHRTKQCPPDASAVIIPAHKEPADMLRRPDADRSDKFGIVECAVKGQSADFFTVVQVSAKGAHALLRIVRGFKFQKNRPCQVKCRRDFVLPQASDLIRMLHVPAPFAVLLSVLLLL